MYTQSSRNPSIVQNIPKKTDVLNDWIIRLAFVLLFMPKCALIAELDNNTKTDEYEEKVSRASDGTGIGEVRGDGDMCVG